LLPIDHDSGIILFFFELEIEITQLVESYPDSIVARVVDCQVKVACCKSLFFAEI